MKSTFRVLLVAMAVAAGASATQAIPADIRVFVRNADTCEHLAGEWDSDLSPARKREIERGVDNFCLAAQRQLQQVEVKYRGDRTLRALIARHSHDAVRSYRK